MPCGPIGLDKWLLSPRCDFGIIRLTSDTKNARLPPFALTHVSYDNLSKAISRNMMRIVTLSIVSEHHRLSLHSYPEGQPENPNLLNTFCHIIRSTLTLTHFVGFRGSGAMRPDEPATITKSNILSMEVPILRLIYFWRHRLYRHVQSLCATVPKDDLNSSLYQLAAIACDAKLGSIDGALRSLQSVGPSLCFHVTSCALARWNSDGEVIERSERAITTALETPTQDPLFLIAMKLAWLFGEFRLAALIAGAFPDSNRFMIVLGWVRHDEGRFADALELFAASKRGVQSDCLTLYGQGLTYEATGDYARAFEAFAQVLSLCNFPEIHIERAICAIQLGNWGLVREIARESSKLVKDRMEVSVLRGLCSLVLDADTERAGRRIQKVSETIEKVETGNSLICWELSSLFASLTSAVYSQTMSLLKLVTKPSSESRLVAACHHIVAGDFLNGWNSLQEIDRVNVVAFEREVEVLCGLKRVSQARDILDFCLGIGLSSPRLLSSQYEVNGLSYHEFLKALPRCPLRTTDSVFRCVRADDYLVCLRQLLNTTFYVRFFGEQLQELVDGLVGKLPGYVPFRVCQGLLLRRTRRLPEAKAVLENVMRSRWIYRMDACYVSLADIALSMGQPERAQELLDEAADRTSIESADFTITRAQAGGPANLAHLEDEPLPVLFDAIRAAIDLKQLQTASKFVAKAAKVATGYEKVCVLLFEGLLKAAAGDVDQGLTLVERARRTRRVKKEVAKIAAEIHFKFAGDPDKGVTILRNLWQRTHSRIVVHILRDYCFERKDYQGSVDVLQEVCGSAGDLFSIHKLFVTIKKAHLVADLSYFENRRVLPEVVDLMIELGQLDAARRTVEHQLLIIPDKTVENGVFAWQLGKIHFLAEEYQLAFKAFEDALAVLESNATSLDPNSIVLNLRHMISDLCIAIAECVMCLPIRERVVEFYQKSLHYNENNATAVKSLINLHKSRGDVKSCSQVCATFMKKHPMNEEIALIYSNYSFREFSEVFDVLKKIAGKTENVLIAIRMVEIGARAGRLAEVKEFIKTMPSNVKIATALYFLYKGRSDKSLKLFRETAETKAWKGFSELYIFAILLNPRRMFAFLESTPIVGARAIARAEAFLATMNVPAREKLFLQAEIDLAKRNAQSIHNATETFRGVLRATPDDLRASLGLAKCLFYANSHIEAQTILTTITNQLPVLESFGVLEEALMLMSSLTTDENRLNFINRALTLNQSCTKAWELRGKHYLGQHNYKEASFAFAQFWRLSRRDDVETGYDYAYSCVKIGRWSEAMWIARQILEIHPSYRDIEERIIKRSFRNLWGNQLQ
jgi:tetratricopeptide (TPR) repeat protein